MNATKTSRLFRPIELGSTRLKHRVVMAPLTRSRSVQPDGVPGDLMLEYYSQRASDGGLIISEAAQLVSPLAVGMVRLVCTPTPKSTDGRRLSMPFIPRAVISSRNCGTPGGSLTYL